MRLVLMPRESRGWWVGWLVGRLVGEIGRLVSLASLVGLGWFGRIGGVGLGWLVGWPACVVWTCSSETGLGNRACNDPDHLTRRRRNPILKDTQCGDLRGVSAVKLPPWISHHQRNPTE